MTGEEQSDTPPIYSETTGPLRDGIISVNSSLEVTACNSVVRESLRIPESDGVGKSLWDLFPEATGTVAETAIRAALTSGQQRSFERYYPSLDTWFEVRVYPDGDGGLSLFLTERGEETRDYRVVEPFEHSGGSSGVGGWRIDLPSKTLHVSDEVLRIRGLPPDYDLTLQEGLQFYHPQDRPIIETAVERLKAEGVTYDLELREVTDDGDIYWVRTTGVAEYDDGDIVALRGVYRDITERKENEIQLQRRTHELTRQNERLDEFAGVVSHDLRNPLNVAQGRLALVEDQIDEEHYDELDTALTGIETLIEDVLTLARYGKEVEATESVDLAAVLEQCWEAAGSTDARLVLRDVPTVLADRSRLDQLVGNLVRNAIEHGPDDVTVTVGGLDGGFYVADDGPGIPRADREAVFESGYSMSRTGTGFGLAIVRQIAEAHHWQVHITESADAGTRFEFTGVERP